MNITVNVEKEISFNVGEVKNYTSELKKVTGVYVFFDKFENPVYIGKSKDLYGRVISHINGKSEKPKIKELSRLCKIYKIEDYAMADIYETYLINELKPLLNIDKATYGDFIKMAEEELVEVDCRIDDLKFEILELKESLVDEDDLGELLFSQRKIEELEKEIVELEAKASRLKRRGAKPMENITYEMIVKREKERRRNAYLSMRK
ncbi:nucleotide excision repair endonuclease [Robertmurraya sp. DFI.2.37]|uniref:nucleotide excision repair endonuclease n=1 Tax=Robertmurraya sp. DFI.2.37 TaxID=3031819 RepID=UPI00178471A2|nr:nucleotide excision repair endonuclease [Robertmurraya sp. DFI.2.37]MDF1510860.1 nucleotide excision repair endonuclease [Robertmurraya sp. DFI.2.37]